MIELTTVVVWIFTIITSIIPPGRLAEQESFIPEAMESKAQVEERYNAWADAITNEVYVNNNTLFGGAEGKKRTVALVLSIMYHESGFRRDVDNGAGRERLARSGWNDHGKSWCLMQLHLGKKAVQKSDGTWMEDSAANTDEGYTGRELLADRSKCVKAGINVLRKSLAACKRLPSKDWLRAYASGTCDNGEQESQRRMRFMQVILEKYSPSWKDKDVVIQIQKNEQQAMSLE
jgi:hypothetical protein